MSTPSTSQAEPARITVGIVYHGNKCVRTEEYPASMIQEEFIESTGRRVKMGGQWYSVIEPLRISLPARCAQYPLCSLEKGHAGDCRRVSRAGLEGK